MNLVIDIGNTRTKTALFEKGALKSIKIFPSELLLAELPKQIKLNDVKKCILASVAEKNDAIFELLKKNVPQTLIYFAQTKIPVKNMYKTSGTLGNDRIPSVIPAAEQHPGKDVLVIDAGTCVKYNFINKNGEFIGGAISPGLQMRFKALNNFTARLPLLQADETFTDLTGTDTKRSILSGVQNGIANEIDMSIAQYSEKHPDIKVFLTGGDSQFLAKRLKNRIFTDPDLVLKGLNTILEFNTQDLL